MERKRQVRWFIVVAASFASACSTRLEIDNTSVRTSSLANADGTCNDEWVQTVVLAEAAEDKFDQNGELEEARSYVKLDCNLTLDPEDVVTKRIIVEGDFQNLTLDCADAKIDGGPPHYNHYSWSPYPSPGAWTPHGPVDMITIRSKESSTIDSAGIPVWRRPQNITVKRCNIIGSVRVKGMEGDSLFESSFMADHTTRARNNAPTGIIFDQVTITGFYRNPLYFGVGVTNSQLINSELNGSSTAIALYLDAESSGNTIRNNNIHVDTDTELLMIDGSSGNHIIDNWFSALDGGGISLYRNCGERGVARHSTPSNNHIINNIFYYDDYYIGPSPWNPSVRLGVPSIHLGSRNGEPPGFEPPWDLAGYCDDDDGNPYGSGESDLDHATHNVVMQNKIYENDVAYAIWTTNPTVNSPNYIDHNSTVTSAVWQNNLAGCFVSPGDFILHGETVTLSNLVYTCDDSFLRPLPVTLTVNKTGVSAGSATLTAPAGAGLSDTINCGTDCQASYPLSSTVTITASTGDYFVSWSGCDTTDSHRCYVTMSGARNVTATFGSIVTDKSFYAENEYVYVSYSDIPPAPYHIFAAWNSTLNIYQWGSLPGGSAAGTFIFNRPPKADTFRVGVFTNSTNSLTGATFIGLSSNSFFVTQGQPAFTGLPSSFVDLGSKTLAVTIKGVRNHMNDWVELAAPNSGQCTGIGLRQMKIGSGSSMGMVTGTFTFNPDDIPAAGNYVVRVLKANSDGSCGVTQLATSAPVYVTPRKALFTGGNYYASNAGDPTCATASYSCNALQDAGTWYGGSSTSGDKHMNVCFGAGTPTNDTCSGNTMQVVTSVKLNYRWTGCTGTQSAKLQKYYNGIWSDFGSGSIPCQTTYTERIINVTDAGAQGIRIMNTGSGASFYVDDIRITTP
jgi:hypothetical protein